MKITLEAFLPTIKPWVIDLANHWPATVIKPQFAVWEVAHILSLVMLGGTAILINLRLAGVGLKDAPPSEIYRNLRRWQDAAVIGIVVSGLLIGTANAERLYASTAFVVKLLALIAGLILTYGVSRPTAQADGVVSVTARGFLVLGSGVWLLALSILAASVQINPGLLHIVAAAALIVWLAARGRRRVLVLAVLAGLLAIQWVVTTILIRPDDLPRLDPVNQVFAGLFVCWILIAGLAQSGSWLSTKLVGYVSILVWVTAAAAGRWIAFA